MSKRINYCEILGVPPGADDETIKRAYRRLVKRYHPDVCEEPGAAQHFARICEAYEALTGPSRRQRYERAARNERSAGGGTTRGRDRPPPGDSPQPGATQAARAQAPAAGLEQGVGGFWAPYAAHRRRPWRRSHWETRLKVVLFCLLVLIALAHFTITFTRTAPKSVLPPSLPRAAAPPAKNARRNAPSRLPAGTDRAALAPANKPMGGPEQTEPHQSGPAAQAQRIAENAAAAWRRVRALDRGQGMGRRLDQAQQVRRQAQEDFQNGAYRQAIGRYAEAVERCRQIEQYEAKRASARRAQQAADVAWARWNLSQVGGGNAGALREVIEAKDAADQAWQAGRFDQARASYELVCHLLGAREGTKEVRIHCTRARELMETGACREAAAEVEAALSLQPWNEEAAALRDAIDARLYHTLPCGKGAAIRLAWIPAGSFVMGSPAEENGRPDERPQHKVTISRPFYVGVTEVTRAQWTAVMGTEPWKSGSYMKIGRAYPATHVSWEDAREFCKRLSAGTGQTVRLPTEAEWEYACRAGTRRPFSFPDHRDLRRYGNHLDWWEDKSGNLQRHPAGGDGYYWVAPVGSYQPNAWGLYDMHGNVAEWCSDWWDASYYARSASADPVGPGTGSCRVRRGGSALHLPGDCRSAARITVSEGALVGFRVVVAPKAAGPQPTQHKGSAGSKAAANATGSSPGQADSPNRARPAGP